MNIYEKNLEALGKRYPDLVKLVESINIDKERIKVLPTESGDHRILYKKEDGEEIFIHNAEDPAKCANQAIDLLGKMEKEGIAVLFGFGLGYFAEEVLKRFEKGHVLMVYEATPEIFKTALKTRDISDLLDSKQVNIILGADTDSFSFSGAYHHLLASGKFWIIRHHPSLRLNKEAYKKFQKKMEDEKSLTGTNIATQIGLGKDFINTFLQNMPSILRNPGVNRLKDIFKGRPAIIVAAGPSIDKNLHLLKKIKGKAVIIAVDAVLPTLLTCSIIPDVIVAIDPLEDNIRMFKDNPLLKKAPFISLSQYLPMIIQFYPGPLFLSGIPQNVIYQWLSRFWEDKGYIECFGGSVSHFAFSAAMFMGCDTIAFVGQDLSFSIEKYYSQGLESEDSRFYRIVVRKLLEIFGQMDSKVSLDAIKEASKDVPVYMQQNPTFFNVLDKVFSRLNLDDSCISENHILKECRLELFKFSSNISGFIPATNIFNEATFTQHSFRIFKISFENKIKQIKCTVVNASEDGLHIEGTKVMRLADFIEEYCDLPEIDTFSALSELADTKISYNLDGLLSEVKGAKTLFMDIKRKGTKILKYIHRVKKLIDKKQKESHDLHNILNKIETLTEKVKHPILNIIAAYHYKLELYLKRQETQEIDELEDKWERLEKQISRAQNYYPELIEAIDLFLKQLGKLINALERESKVNSILVNNSMSDYEKYSKIGKIYKRAEMASQAVKYLELALKAVGKGELAVGNWQLANQESSIQHPASSIQYPVESLQIDLAEMYVKQFRFYEAKEMLKAIGSGQEAKDSWQLAVIPNPQSPIPNPKSQILNPKLATRIKELLKICDEKIKAWEERKKEMEKLVKAAEANYGGHYESGNFYFRVKDYEQAEKAYLKAIEEQLAVGSWQLANTSIQHPVSSIQHPVSSIQYPATSNQQIVKAYYGLANTYLAMNKPEKCVDTLGKIIEIEPENPSPYCDLGRIAAQNNNLKDAENFLKKAIELAPNMEEPYKLLADLYVNQGEAGKVSSLYEKAVSANPDNPAFTRTLAGIYKNMIS